MLNGYCICDVFNCPFAPVRVLRTVLKEFFLVRVDKNHGFRWILPEPYVFIKNVKEQRIGVPSKRYVILIFMYRSDGTNEQVGLQKIYLPIYRSDGTNKQTCLQ